MDSFPDTVYPPPPSLDACINYLGGVELGQSPYGIVVEPNCISQRLCIILPHYSFICTLLLSLLLLYSVHTSSVLLCSPQHVDLPLVMSNQCHDVTHVGRIDRDIMTFPFEIFKHDVIEVDPLLKGCSVLILEFQILISFASVGPAKKLVCP